MSWLEKLEGIKSVAATYAAAARDNLEKALLARWRGRAREGHAGTLSLAPPHLHPQEEENFDAEDLYAPSNPSDELKARRAYCRGLRPDAPRPPLAPPPPTADLQGHGGRHATAAGEDDAAVHQTVQG